MAQELTLHCVVIALVGLLGVLVLKDIWFLIICLLGVGILLRTFGRAAR